MRVTAPIAIFHLDYFTHSEKHEDKQMRDKSIIRIHHMLELLPSNTRRVFISNSSSHENGIINTAIELGGDVLLTANELLDTENLEGIIRTLEQKGYANDAEINQRGRTIENVNGIKEGIRTAPERQADDRYFDYSDEYYKSGKE